MRPRVFAAEDARHPTSQNRLSRASMRPRVFAAEDPGAETLARLLTTTASMRPRVFAAEDARAGDRPGPPRGALQ